MEAVRVQPAEGRDRSRDPEDEEGYEGNDFLTRTQTPPRRRRQSAKAAIRTTETSVT